MIKRNRQSGVALVTALMFLVILTMLALSSMTNTTLEEKMAANSVGMNRVFQAAESGITSASRDDRTYNASGHTDTLDINDIEVTYEAVPLGGRAHNPPRGSGYAVNTFQAYFFNIRSTAQSPSRASVTLNAGVYQIVPK